jgi:hypothetical protein
MEMPTPDPVSPAPKPSPTDLLSRPEGRSLRRLLQGLVVSLIALSAGVNIFMLRQVSVVRRQAAELRQLVTDYQTNNVPVMNKFVADLQNFSKLYPDFAPVLAKYSKTPAPQSVLDTPPPTAKPPGR